MRRRAGFFSTVGSLWTFSTRALGKPIVQSANFPTDAADTMLSFLDHSSLRSPRHLNAPHTPFRTHTRVRPDPRPRAPQPPQPIVETSSSDEYTITLKAPPGYVVQDASASRVDTSIIELTGTMRRQHTSSSMLYTYTTNARIPAFGAPSLRTHVGFVPAGRRVRGSAPSSAGWVALEDDDDIFVLYDPYDDALRCHGPQQESPLTRFVRHVELPSDALLERATKYEPMGLDGEGDGAVAALQIKVPRRSVSLRSAPHQRRPTATGQGHGFASEKYQERYSTPAAPPTKRAAAKEAPLNRPHPPSPKSSPVTTHTPTSRPVLVEVEPSPCNVQRPEEMADQWVAVEDGSFVPMVMAA